MMSQFKCVVTLTWKLEEDQGVEHCLQLARNQLDQILLPPQGFDDFTVQVDLAPMKTRKTLKHIKSYAADDIFALITEHDERREFLVDGKGYSVRMNSDRYHVFRKNRHCAACGIAGTRMTLDLNPGDSSPHFNLYAEENGKLLLMTKDHKIPKARGGLDSIDNYQCMCSICNNLKGDSYLALEAIRELRVMYDNKSRIPRRELRDLINKRRAELATI